MPEQPSTACMVGGSGYCPGVLCRPSIRWDLADPERQDTTYRPGSSNVMGPSVTSDVTSPEPGLVAGRLLRKNSGYPGISAGQMSACIANVSPGSPESDTQSTQDVVCGKLLMLSSSVILFESV